MKRTINNNGSIYDYLEPFLETGNAEDITQARKQYWRDYKSKWRKEKRQKEKEFTISFTDKELKIINQNAHKHNRSCTRFIKEASLSYCAKKFLFPDLTTLNRIRELLALNYNAMQQLSEESNISNLQADECMMRIADLEKKVLTLLQNPKVLE
jgi:hypothetical protein